jgi:RND family efflux transporter MFP subunit
VRDLQAQAELAQLRFRRGKSLLERNAIAQDEFDRQSLGMRSAEARLEAAQRRLDELEAGTRTEQIEAARASVAQLDAALEDLEIEIEESALVAPFDGVIAKRFLDEGTIVAPNMPVVRVVEDHRLEAWIGLPADIAGRLDGDAMREVKVGRHVHRAHLRTVLPELDAATRTRTAIFELSIADGSVVPAQVARIVISESAETEGFWLPITALSRGTRGLWSVLVAEEEEGSGDTRAVTRDVEVLHTDGDRALIRGAVRAGELVVVDGNHRIVAGQIVRIISRDEPASATQPMS